jgi:hypothetical protein
MNVTRSSVAGAVLCSLLLATPASAQLFEIASDSTPLADAFQNDAAYDPIHDTYFIVAGAPATIGQFFDRSARALGPALTLDPQVSTFVASAAYSPDVSDGTGGHGGFLVIWSSRVGELFAQIVSFPGRAIGLPQRIFVNPHGTSGIVPEITSSDVAYSPIDRIFLVVVEYRNGQSLFDGPSRLIRVNLQGQPVGETALSSDPNFDCFFEGFWQCDVHIVWNPVFQEFGVFYMQGISASESDNSQASDRILARVRGDGTIVSRKIVGFFPRSNSELEVNTNTGNYLAVIGGYGVELAPDGTLVAQGPISTNLNFAVPVRLSYSPAAGTFLLGGRPFSQPGALLELNQHGVPMSALPGPDSLALGAHETAREWIVANRETTRIIGTATPFGGSAALLPDCITPDPFASLGGGRCVNRGWLPPGHPLIPSGTPPTPPPLPRPPTSCTIPDPFTSLGGGVCVGNGWVPRGHPLAGGGS